MKNSIKLIALILCIVMLVPMFTFAYPTGVSQNSAIQMPKASPVIDGKIENNGSWSAAADFSDATVGYFWATNPNTTEADLYFAYDDNGLYFAAKIVDNNSSNGFVASTGYDNINNDGTSLPYGFNGDVMTLMLDPMGIFEKSSYQTTPWYNVGIFADGTVRVYRSKANEADITSSVSAAGKITSTGWRFEVYIPWSIIATDVSAASSSNFSVTEVQLATVGSVSRAACMYMDRYYTSGTTVGTWGRYITVCNSTYEGIAGVYTSGTVAKAYGLILNNYIPTNTLSISNERQLMLEDYVIDPNNTDASFVFGTPVKKEIVFTFDKAYESNDTVYHNIVELPNGTYRMYYKATADRRRICYIESTDGINWTRPNLTTNPYNGAASNIVTGNTVNPDNLFVFYDTNPDCPADERWKGIYGQWGDGLFLEYSDDGNHFTFWPDEAQMMGTPTATQGCYFDTLNTVYWDEARDKYVAFVRGFHEGSNYNLSKEYVQTNSTSIVRDIRVAYSDDCLNWTTPVPLVYDDGADHQMYANAIIPYYRAEQLYIGMPTRYQWPAGSSYPVTDIYLMSSRDLLNWDRTESPYMTPDQVTGATWQYGDSGYPCIGYIQTGENEMSFYMKEKNSNGITVLYRYTLRIDGFRSAHGDTTGKEVVTQYMTFTGSALKVNYATASGGQMRVTMTDANGNSIQSGWMTGDDINASVSFNGSISDFAGEPVTLTFELYNSDLYSFKFY